VGWNFVGKLLGLAVGLAVGLSVGDRLCLAVGDRLGIAVRLSVGDRLGLAVGLTVTGLPLRLNSMTISSLCLNGFERSSTSSFQRCA
jgi:hypothetical protein